MDGAAAAFAGYQPQCDEFVEVQVPCCLRPVCQAGIIGVSDETM